MNKKLRNIAMPIAAAAMIAGASSCVNDQNVEYNDNSVIIQNNMYRSGGCYGTDAYRKQQSKLWQGYKGILPVQSNSVTKNVQIDNSYSRDFFNINSKNGEPKIGNW